MVVPTLHPSAYQLWLRSFALTVAYLIPFFGILIAIVENRASTNRSPILFELKVYDFSSLFQSF